MHKTISQKTISALMSMKKKQKLEANVNVSLKMRQNILKFCKNLRY